MALAKDLLRAAPSLFDLTDVEIARRVGKDYTGYHVSLARAELYGEGLASPAAQDDQPEYVDFGSDSGPTIAARAVTLTTLPDGEEAMNTLAIAELTGKRHDHVLRDADKMLKDLGLVGDPKFGATYLTSQNKQARCLNLPYNLPKLSAIPEPWKGVVKLPTPAAHGRAKASDRIG